MSGFVFHPDAYKDLEEIWEYISADSLDAADRLLAEIEEAIRTLSRFPRMGHPRPDLSSKLRFHPVSNFLIAYAPESPLSVIAILHGRRSPRIMAALLRQRT